MASDKNLVLFVNKVFFVPSLGQQRTNTSLPGAYSKEWPALQGRKSGEFFYVVALSYSIVYQSLQI